MTTQSTQGSGGWGTVLGDILQRIGGPVDPRDANTPPYFPEDPNNPLPTIPRRGGNNTNLPDMVGKNPDAYADLLGLDYKDPLAYYDAASGGEARGLGASNGLVVIHKPDEGKGATAAVLADIANRANNERLRRSMGGGQQPGSTPSQMGTIGDLAGLGLGYLKGMFDSRGQQAQPTGTPASESGLGRMGGGGGPGQGGMPRDQYSRIFGGTGVTPGQAGGFGQPAAPPQGQPAPQMQPQATGTPIWNEQMPGGLGTSGGGVTGAEGGVNWGQLLGAVIGGQR